MSQLVEAGFVATQLIRLNRQKACLPACYFLTMTGLDDENFVRADEKTGRMLKQDFWKGEDYEATGKGPVLKVKYPYAYINVTSKIRGAVLEMLAQEKRLLKRVRSFNQINIDFLSFESRVFTLNSPGALSKLMGGEGSRAEAVSMIGRWQSQLATLCILLNEKPYVRYEDGKDMMSKYVKSMANYFNTELNSTLGKLTNWKPRPNAGTLLIVGRTTDLVSAVTHQMTYQSALNEVMGMKGEVINTEAKDEKGNVSPVSYVLDENDEYWSKYRNMQILQAIDQIQAGWKQYKAMFEKLSENAQYSRQSELKEKTKIYSKHASMLSKAYTEYQENRMTAVNVLQALASGMNITSGRINAADLWDAVKGCVENAGTAEEDKARVMISYALCRGGVLPSEMKTFESNASARSVTALKNLSQLGYNVNRPDRKRAFTKSKSHQALIQEKYKSTDKRYRMGYQYRSKIESLVLESINDSLDKKEFPWITEPPKGSRKGMGRITGFTRRQRGRRNGTRTGGLSAEKTRLIVFVLGGITTAEMGTIYALEEQYPQFEIYIGSTDIINGQSVIDCLAKASS